VSGEEELDGVDDGRGGVVDRVVSNRGVGDEGDVEVVGGEDSTTGAEDEGDVAASGGVPAGADGAACGGGVVGAASSEDRSTRADDDGAWAPGDGDAVVEGSGG
jgi:hypothetical protein